MTDWHGRTASTKFAARLNGSVLRTLDRLCREAGTSETGGILIGHYSADRAVAIVQEATPPPTDSRRGRSWFVRGVGGLRNLLSRRWQASERTYYLGEWHFHPVAHVEPSDDDFAQMAEISRAAEYECKEPLLIILGTGRPRRERAFRAFVCPRAGAPLELLPTPDSDSRPLTAAGAVTRKS